MLLAATFLLVGAMPALAQGRAGGRGPGGGMMAAQNPVSYLVEHGEELALTTEQKEALGVLADSLDVVNAPDFEKLEAARASGDRTPWSRRPRPC